MTHVAIKHKSKLLGYILPPEKVMSNTYLLSSSLATIKNGVTQYVLLLHNAQSHWIITINNEIAGNVGLPKLHSYSRDVLLLQSLLAVWRWHQWQGAIWVPRLQVLLTAMSQTTSDQSQVLIWDQNALSCHFINILHEFVGTAMFIVMFCRLFLPVQYCNIIL